MLSIEDVEVFENMSEEVLCKKGLPIPTIKVKFAPTVPHCHVASIIGLTIIYQLSKFTKGYWIQVSIKEGTHQNEDIYNKQLRDIERVYAAFENENIFDLISDCLPNID